MSELELRQIAFLFSMKGYNQHDQLRDSDDLYHASQKEKDQCCLYLDEIIDDGANAQSKIIIKLQLKEVKK